MAIDKQLFIENFLNESRDNLITLGDVVISLRKSPEDTEKLAELLRLLHTIKGSSRMMEFSVIEAIAHGLEDVFKGIRDKRYSISKPLIQLVLSSIDYLERGLQSIKSIESDQIPINSLEMVFQKAVSGLPFSLDELMKDRVAIEDQEEIAGILDTKKKEGLSDYETIRIKLSKVDEIVKHLNSLIIQQFQFKKENERISELEESLREAANKIHNLIERHPGLDDIGIAVDSSVKLTQSIRKSYTEEMAQLEHISFELQEEVLGLRMLPMELVLGPLKKMVEETSLMMGKEINFEITGTDLLLDKTILEQINDPIIHLVRNAIDHGIESQEERTTAGKDKQGNIKIICSAESGRINIKIQDDGKGLNYTQIKKKALNLYPDREEEINEMDRGGLSVFLFQSGFTTTKKVTNLSGRGVGLDIVKSNIEGIKGKITLSSEDGQGSSFTMSLPLSLATVDGFFITCQNERFLIPTAFVKEIINIKRDEVITILNRNVIRVRDMIIPIYPLSSLLDKDETSVSDKLSIVVVESLGDIIGIAVESVNQFVSLIYKPLPGSMVKLKIIQGIVFDENFEIINILFVPQLISRFKGIRNIEFRKRFSPKNKEYKQILVVDDSLSTREIEKSILELDDYNVDLAVDGIDAMEKIKEKYFHLIITDLQMPRMDGFTLIENIKRQEKYKNTPIIVVSSDNSKDVVDRINEIGGNGLINKRDFDRGSLLQKVKEFIG